MHSEQPLSPCLNSILSDGAYLIVSHAPRQAEILARARSLILSGVEELEGAHAHGHLVRQGLTRLHDVLPATRIGALRDLVMSRLRNDLFDLAVGVGRKILGLTEEFFVDDYTILRINFPYLVARQAAHSAENPGIGRTAESTRAAARESRVVDPVYDPKAYHRNEPPAAWAHGPHLDTWTGHSRDGVNLWWALDEVQEHNSMLFYPETFGQPFQPDPRSLYLKEGQPLPKPVKMSLRKGEMLVFNPEMLHGTHLNISDCTRLAISTRINARRPKFSPACFYAREFWHSSQDIESRRYDETLRFKRDENLEVLASNLSAAASPPTPPVTSSCAAPHSAVVDATTEGCFKIGNASSLKEGGKLLVRAGEDEILVLRAGGQVYAMQARCPHLGISLADGHHDEHAIHCPAHGMSFDPRSGASACPILNLRTYAVWEADGCLRLQLSPEKNRACVDASRAA